MAKSKTAMLPKLSTSDLPKLSAPAHRALAGAGISNLKQLSKFTEADIKKLHGIGPNAIKELQAALKAKGLAFRK
jgi:Bacterial RNA polymerase, alpha chain C terminal domain